MSANLINCLGDRNCEIRICELGMKENFGSEKSFVSDLDVEGLLGDGVGPGVFFDVLVRVLVELAELFRNVRTNVTVPDKNKYII